MVQLPGHLFKAFENKNLIMKNAGVLFSFSFFSVQNYMKVLQLSCHLHVQQDPFVWSDKCVHAGR